MALSFSLAAFAVLLTSWSAFVLGPQLQLGGAKQVAVLNSSDIYPLNRPGQAAQGLAVYRANGYCAACHTEQVQQDGMACEVVLMSAGKRNPSAVSNLISTLKLNGLTEQEAEAASIKITGAGGKVGKRIFLPLARTFHAAGACATASRKIFFTITRCNSAAFASDRTWRMSAAGCRMRTRC